ncbi:MAG: DoxX family protein [Terriglobales bacterium]
MQSVFSSFPDGLPGAGLLLLRAAAGIALLIQGAAYLVDRDGLGFLTLAVGLLTVASGLLLLIGYLTPLAGALAVLFCVGSAFSWFPAPSLELFEAKLTAALGTAIVAALVCLGPGAFSLDGRLFGRREIIIPNGSPSSKS